MGDLHFPTTLEAVEYKQTASGCAGSGNADALRSHNDLLVVDENSQPVERLRLPSGVVRDGRCVFSVRLELPAGVHELWLATRGGSARTVTLANRRHAQRDGSSISVTITPKHG